MGDILDETDSEAPPAGVSAPVAALWWLARGGWKTGPDWHRAHDLCQQNEGDNAHDWVHALVHRIEGDTQNADYWYRRAGERPEHQDVAREARHILKTLQG